MNADAEKRSMIGRVSAPVPAFGPAHAAHRVPLVRLSFQLFAQPDPQIGTPTFSWRAHAYSGFLTLATASGPGTPDYLSISSFGTRPPGFLAVDEGTTGSVELWGRPVSVEFLEFRNPPNATIVSEIPTPEPATGLQMLAGLGELAAARRFLRRGSGAFARLVRIALL